MAANNAWLVLHGVNTSIVYIFISSPVCSWYRIELRREEYVINPSK